jgi:transcriptional regulator with XRE-family HTH domain
MHLGTNIKVLRLAKGLSQEELAAKINKTRPLISYIEQKGKINSETLKTIAKALDVDVDDIESLVNEPSKGGKGDKVALQKQIKTLEKENETLRDLVESQKQVIDLLKRKK